VAADRRAALYVGLMNPMSQLTAHLDPVDRDRVQARLHSNLMAWLTTVRPDGRPDTVPVWFLARPEGTILVYTRPDQRKLRNIADNPHVALGLDVTDLGRNIVRLAGTALHDPDAARADADPAYLAKYVERMAAMFGTPQAFAQQFSAALVITPTRLLV
jgi:PPOX class probable F420-dependent enzyme